MDTEGLQGRECFWRYTAETPKFLGLVDSRALFPFLLLAFHMRWWVLYLALSTTLFFVVLGMFRIQPFHGMRAALLWIVTLGFRRAHLAHRKSRHSVSALFD